MQQHLAKKWRLPTSLAWALNAENIEGWNLENRRGLDGLMPSSMTDQMAAIGMAVSATANTKSNDWEYSTLKWSLL
jgi:hypothetical protein